MRIGNRRLGVLTLVSGLLLNTTCQDDARQSTGVLLTVTLRDYAQALTRVEVAARDIDYDRSLVSEELNGRDLAREPLEIFIGESRLTTDPVSGRPAPFLLHARGFDGSQQQVADARLVTIVKNEVLRVTLTMRPDFVDTDGDGFAACGEPGCDCNDQNSSINPFTRERCGDQLDNNCSGLPVDEQCPCSPEGAVRACTTLPFVDQPELKPFVGIGWCRFGTQVCQGGLWQAECVGGGNAPKPEELGNDLDDNCNGVVDEGDGCTPNTTRPCLLGRIAAGPAGYNFDGLAYGPQGSGIRCRTGIQQCNASGRWENGCSGEVRPQRDPSWVGFVELPATTDQALIDFAVSQQPPAGNCETNDCTWHASMGQCDGVDNDCDGLFDEEAWFDSDRDAQDQPAPDGYTFCGTVIDTQGGTLAVTDPASRRAGLAAEFIDCDDSDPTVNPGAIELCNNAIDEDCRCDHDSQNRPATDSNSEIGKPYNGVYSFTLGIQPAPTCPSTAAFLDCARQVRSDATMPGSCADGPDRYYYGYFPDLVAGDCYLCADGFGTTCSPIDPSRCNTKAEDCNPCETRGAEAASRPLCSVPNPAECTVDVPLTSWILPLGEDPNNECAAQACGNNQPGNGGGPFFWGIDRTDPAAPRCYLNADVTGMCDGAAACMTRASECQAAVRGFEEPNRPLCMKPLDGSCLGAAAPNYGGFVSAGIDPYNECAGTCDGTGACFKQFGEGCASASPCEPPYHCVDGVCCESACDQPCQACSATLTGGPDGSCLNIMSQVVDRQPLDLCADTYGCGGPHCVCEAGTGDCRRDNGDPCAGHDDCATSACRTDWDGSGQFCAQSTTACVVDVGSSRLQLANAQTRCGGSDPALTTKTCNSGSWGGDVACGGYVCNGTTGCYTTCASNDNGKCIADDHCDNGTNSCVGDFGAGAACQEDSDCTSGRCRTIWSGGQSRCAPNATACVSDDGTAVASGTPLCGGSAPNFNTKTCSNGVWGGQVNCGHYVCNGTSGCFADCSVNDDSKCIAADHCATATNSCVADLLAGVACTESSDCASGSCRLGWGGSGSFCAPNATACVLDDGTQISDGASRCGSIGASFTTKSCSAGSWTNQVNCGTYRCSGTTSCLTNCDANDDSRCVTGAYCDESYSPDACVGQLPAGSGCTVNADCQSNACRTDWDGSGKFCAQDLTSCVYDTGATVTQYSNSQTYCGGGGTSFTTKRCGNGVWGSDVACGAYTCNGTTGCYTDCATNLDSKCTAINHCNSSNQCVADLATGGACSEPSDCVSGYCRTDWDGSGTFCAQDSLSCVYDTGAGRNQYANGQSLCAATGATFSTRTCGNGVWVGTVNCGNYTCDGTTACFSDCGTDDTRCTPVNHCGPGSLCVADFPAGAACVEGSDCSSNYCRSDYDADGTFCADDGTSCVAAGTSATATDVNNAAANCYGGDRFLCSNGTWSTTDCFLYECSAGACYANCESNLDARCVGTAHCVAVGGSGNDVCALDLAAGAACTENSDCVSGFCRDDWDGSGRFCADDGSSCVAAGASATAVDVNTGTANCNGGDSYVCNNGVWVTTDCTFYGCNAGACFTNCESNNDTLCVATAHCVAVGGANNDTCNPDLAAGQPCLEDSDCTSGSCRDDWDGVGKFCADDGSSCVAAGTSATATDVNTTVAVCYSGDSYLCGNGVWTASECGLYACASGVCNAHCESDSDTLCVASAHCDSIGGPANDVCVLDFAAGQSCIDDTDCASGFCRTDWDGSGRFCADDGSSCVAAGASATATDVNTTVAVCYAGDRYQCSSGSWVFTDCVAYGCNAGVCYSSCASDNDTLCASGYHCLAANNQCYDGSAGQPCDVNADCASTFCRDDWDGVGKFCADDASSCVAAGTSATATDVNTGSGTCAGGDSSLCTNGSWSLVDCGLYLCNAGSCYANCEPNDDALCVAAAHCVVVPGANNDTCAADLAAGAACVDGGDCVSGYCRTDWDDVGTFCAQDATSCVYDNGATRSQILDTNRRCAGTDPAFSTRGCAAGLWSAPSSCGLYVCNGTADCWTSCAPDDDDKCAGSNHCFSGDNLCYTDASGQKCDANNDCASNNCLGSNDCQ